MCRIINGELSPWPTTTGSGGRGGWCLLKGGFRNNTNDLVEEGISSLYSENGVEGIVMRVVKCRGRKVTILDHPGQSKADEQPQGTIKSRGSMVIWPLLGRGIIIGN